MKSAPRFFFFLFAALALTGCQTYPVKSIAEVKKGQEKREVLELMGSPDSTWRYQGIDRWTYIIYTEDNTRADKEVHFQESRVIYVGKPMEAIVPATEQDALNDKTNAEAQKEMEAAWKARYKGLDSYQEAVHPTKAPTPLPTFNEIQ